MAADFPDVSLSVPGPVSSHSRSSAEWDIWAEIHTFFRPFLVSGGQDKSRVRALFVKRHVTFAERM